MCAKVSVVCLLIFCFIIKIGSDNTGVTASLADHISSSN